VYTQYLDGLRRCRQGEPPAEQVSAAAAASLSDPSALLDRADAKGGGQSAGAEATAAKIVMTPETLKLVDPIKTALTLACPDLIKAGLVDQKQFDNTQRILSRFVSPSPPGALEMAELGMFIRNLPAPASMADASNAVLKTQDLFRQLQATLTPPVARASPASMGPGTPKDKEAPKLVAEKKSYLNPTVVDIDAKDLYEQVDTLLQFDEKKPVMPRMHTKGSTEGIDFELIYSPNGNVTLTISEGGIILKNHVLPELKVGAKEPTINFEFERLNGDRWEIYGNITNGFHAKLTAVPCVDAATCKLLREKYEFGFPSDAMPSQKIMLAPDLILTISHGEIRQQEADGRWLPTGKSAPKLTVEEKGVLIHEEVLSRRNLHCKFQQSDKTLWTVRGGYEGYCAHRVAVPPKDTDFLATRDFDFIGWIAFDNAVKKNTESVGQKYHICCGYPLHIRNQTFNLYFREFRAEGFTSCKMAPSDRLEIMLRDPHQRGKLITGYLGPEETKDCERIRCFIYDKVALPALKLRLAPNGFDVASDNPRGGTFGVFTDRIDAGFAIFRFTNTAAGKAVSFEGLIDDTNKMEILSKLDGASSYRLVPVYLSLSKDGQHTDVRTRSFLPPGAKPGNYTLAPGMDWNEGDIVIPNQQRLGPVHAPGGHFASLALWRHNAALYHS